MSNEQGPRRRFLVNELRRARSEAGLSQEELGKAISYSGSLVSAVENSQRPPTREYLAAIDVVLKTGGLFERLLAGPVTVEQAPEWFREWVYLERKATLIRWYESLLVPGLLQTEEYAHAIFAGARTFDSARIDSLVATRMARQNILAGPDAPTLIVLLDEGVLTRPVGSDMVMAAQCEYLIDRATLPNVQIHVVPTSAGAYAGLAGPFSLARGDAFEAVHLDTAWQAQIVDSPAAVDQMMRRWESIRGEALPRKPSLDLVENAAKSWRSRPDERFDLPG